METFLSRLMEDNPTTGDLMDDEYYLFAGEGTPSRIYMFFFPHCVELTYTA
jgi:hypothetical protein